MHEKFTDENFRKEVVQSNIPVLIDFYAEWCGPCKMLGPIIDEIGDEYKGRVKVGKLNIDEEPDTAAQFHVMSVPTLFIMKNGQIIDSIVGAVSKEIITEKLDKVIAS